jgi:uncharacterized protein YndB with AHSA1/START domain
MNPDLRDDHVVREIVTTRVFDAPRELVFRAWTEAEHLSRWWGPKGFTLTIHEFDPRPGGAWRFVMHGPNGADYPNACVFVEISPPYRIVIDHISEPRFRVTATFDDLGGKTKLSFRQLFETPGTFEKIRSIAVPANEEVFDRLAAELSAMGGGRHEMLLARIVGAPRDLVWEVWTNPTHLARWWGPRGFSNPRCEVDLREGGAIRIDMRGPDGVVYPMAGRFLEIVKPRRLVFTALPLDSAGAPIFEGTNAIEFHEMGAMTRIELRSTVEKIHDPIALRYLSGREQGWSESLYRLADALGALIGRPESGCRA